MTTTRFAPAKQAAVLLLALAIPASQGQQSAGLDSATAVQTPQSAPSSPANAPQTKSVRQPTGSERGRAAKLYLAAAKLYERGQFQEAAKDYQQAATLDPTNEDYRMAVEVARGHAATALIQAAAADRTRGDTDGARTALERALEIDPGNPQVGEHLREIRGYGVDEPAVAANPQASQTFGGMEHVQPSPGVHSFHMRTNQRTAIQQVFKAYGIEATVDDSIRTTLVRVDMDDASFAEATRALGLVTDSFYVSIDEHRALVAKDTRENREKFTRNGVETVYLAGLTTTEMTDVGNMARNIFEMQSAVNPSAGTMTLRAPESKLVAFNSTLNSLMDGRSQVLLDVRLIQLAHTSEINTGVQPPQQVTAFNVYAEEQSILNANQSLVQQIISSGLASPGDTLAILGILLASGQVSSSLFSNGVALFGGGLTLSGLSPGPATVNLNLNSSDSRELDDYQLRLGDGEEGTLRSGTRYPIMTSSFSSLGASSLNIPGLTSAGNSSSLSSILSSLGGASTTIPQVQYQDLGLTLKATPRVMRSGDVALTIDMKITALAGAAINGVPVLANRAWSGVVTMGQGQAVVVASEVDKQESRAIDGTPGLSEIPGLNNITGKDTQKSDSTLLIVITPHVIRSPRIADHSPMMRIERNLPAR